MPRIPQFKTLDEAAEFWETHDFEDYIADTEPVNVRIKLSKRQKVLTIPVDSEVYERIEQLAGQSGVPVERLVSDWLAEKTK